LESALGSLVGKENIIIVSDHGFGKQDLVFDLGKWLVEAGYSREKKEKKRDLLTCGRDLYRKIMPAGYFRSRLSGSAKRLRLIREAQEHISELEGGIDIKNSAAFTLGHSIPFGAIYLNLEERERYGVVPREEYENTREKISEDLRMFLGKSDIQAEIEYPEEIYHGPYVKYAPDIMILLDGGGGVVVSKGEGGIIERRPYSGRHFGSHRMDGIFVAHGPAFDMGQSDMQSLDIKDVIPLCAVLSGAEPGLSLDGVLPVYLLSREEIDRKAAAIHTMKEKERVRDKLKSLK
ncbi:MAG: alkaline phosphatase family protein, partial [Actinomycetota bacterium]